MLRITRLRAAVAAAALTALLAAGAVAVAAIPDSSGTINACYGSNGKLRAVDAPADCGGSETSIALGGPTHGYAYSNADFATIEETTTVVGSLALPAGSYLVHGKLDLLGSSSTAESFVVCNLRVDGTTTNSDSVWNTIEPGVPGRLPSESVAMQTSIMLPAGGTMLMTCVRPDGDAGAIARYRHLDAIRVDGLTTS
ncbi:MAG: hypothetical protein ACRDPX_10820 [Gaiellaceae bacterium]